MPKRKKKILQQIEGSWTLAEVIISYKPIINDHPAVKSQEDAEALIRTHWDNKKINLQEEFVAFFFNTTNKIIGHRLISTGSMKQCIVDIRLLVSLALHCLADNVIIAHNHPSGNLKMSEQDVRITQKIKEALHLIDVKLLDHFIITSNGFTSFAAEGVL
jgi:DNA repair protein RadC